MQVFLHNIIYSHINQFTGPQKNIIYLLCPPPHTKQLYSVIVHTFKLTLGNFGELYSRHYSQEALFIPTLFTENINIIHNIHTIHTRVNFALLSRKLLSTKIRWWKPLSKSQVLKQNSTTWLSIVKFKTLAWIKTHSSPRNTHVVHGWLVQLQC